jgi:hypothetical protein
VQLSDSENDAAFLFVYRLNDGSTTKRFVLRELDPDATYELMAHIPAEAKPRTVRGAVLMSEGIEVALPLRRQAAVFVLTKTT